MPAEVQLRAALKAQEEKLSRQEAAVEATKGMIELIRQQLEAGRNAPPAKTR